MTEELQNYVWQNCLPKEFKEEVKKVYCTPGHRAEVYTLLQNLFGAGNLTSDAEGEEWLTVPRSKVQKLYRDYCAECDNEEMGSANRLSLGGRLAVLTELFGSKCLPDETKDETKDETNEPKPAEPKFKVGDTASYVCSPMLKHKSTVTKVMQNKHSGKWEYNVMFEWGKPGMWIPESDLEPYTESEKESPKKRNP